ncbi:guanine-N(7)-methyltransferase [Dendrothele bispora CBS 962.96]|uniref:mRNA cap guanine-N(7) methyltransferase n=1 Tax=Dendrothele bispora (strain CBS 962.96) TaxID=1314807 RepID=A0A4S8MAF7_DENBC|nr:guanine-N(7)-methyltransferase [Dendrothele bispora CBS 962.96]THV01741.1 guanine-N(7)-methyltransferase [Dendrothele bispora CBS 962.96]
MPAFDPVRDAVLNSPTNDTLPPSPSFRRREVSTIPYKPASRISPPSSVLIPMTPEEMKMLKSFRGRGTSRLINRKRARSYDPDDIEQPPSKKLADNSRPDVGVLQRLDSPIIGLKNFNNWVKSVLISSYAHPALLRSRLSRGNRRGKVLDLGCGKGGDLTKWTKAKIMEYVGADIAAVSVDQARSRWEGIRAPRFDASFAALDCYTESLTTAFSPETLSQSFDVVSMQFCMHYAFESESKARCMLGNVSRWLRGGGIFIGTIPNAEQLLDHLNDIPADSQDLSFGNSVYKIRFESRDHRGDFGNKYWFFLQDAVEDVPEYIVLWDTFVKLASEYGLHPVYKEEFHQVFAQNRSHHEFGPLMVRMKVVDSSGESSMDEDQWEAANIYIAFAFQKN